ncbi:MAG: YHS domain-containing protein [Nitrospiria bacterium]
MIRVTLYAVLGLLLMAVVGVWLSAGRRVGTRGAPGVPMVQDPVCATYLLKNRALMRRVSGVDYLFCSEVCADIFERKAASAGGTDS